MLLFSTAAYLQYLEGPAEALAEAKARIVADRRHEVVWQVGGRIAAPRLPGLAMGYYDADREPSARAGSPLLRDLGNLPADESAALVTLLVDLAREKYPSALGEDGAG